MPPALPIETFRQQQGDVLLFQTDDEGEINVENGLVQMTSSFETAVYLSLFGGNEDDNGSQDSINGWWGNIDENQLEKQYRSEAQHILQGTPATSGNLRRVEDAAVRDLNWMLSSKVASKIAVAASIPGLNRIKLVIDIEAIGEESRFEFVENWKVAP